MNKIKLAFKLLQDSGNFEPSQLHEGKDRLWITPYGNVIDFKQLQLAMAAAELFHLNEWLQVTEYPKIRTCWNTGTGRFCHNLDYTSDFTTLLARPGVRYEIGNDAPRGGKNGTYVLINLK